MSLSFLPDELNQAVGHLNYNFLTEVRLRKDKPVVVEYKGEYSYLGEFGICSSPERAVVARDIATVLNAATDGCIYAYTEQMKNGFITVGHGMRIGIAGEYVTENGRVNAVKNVTSLNVRIPHSILGCSDGICEKLFTVKIYSALIYSKPGLGKTTMLRDIARRLSMDKLRNVLVLDERNEISATDGYGEGFDLGFSDVVRCHNKLGAVSSAIRAMKPDVIITDELYGREDIEAVKYAYDCGITVIASSHITDREILKTMPFDYYIKLNSVGGAPEIYDKNFNSFSDSRLDYDAGDISFGK